MAKAISTMSITELQAEIARRQRDLPRLQKRRAKLAKQLGTVDRQIAALAGKPGPAPRAKAGKATRKVRRRRMPRNTKPLVDYVADVLAKAPKGIRVKEIEAAVKKAGYKTNAKDFYGIVATTVRDKRFQKVGRGIYKLKSQKKTGKATAKKAGRRKATRRKAVAKKAAGKAVAPAAAQQGQ